MNGTRTFDEDGRLLDQEIRRLRSTLVAMCDRETRKRSKPPSHHALESLKSEGGGVIDEDEYIRGTWPLGR